ncbi:unnamed protein product [Rangifer tarandus platyrhynchus]|uniref:Uncharacterized protein n=1 Tax=Rangifer tarandus platyrhynchus TaxID=3082113 RepID=A0AC60A5Z5_RANTA
MSTEKNVESKINDKESISITNLFDNTKQNFPQVISLTTENTLVNHLQSGFNSAAFIPFFSLPRFPGAQVNPFSHLLSIWNQITDCKEGLWKPSTVSFSTTAPSSPNWAGLPDYRFVSF